MAKIKHLKRDIEVLTSEIITECCMAQALFPTIEDQVIDSIIADALEMNEEFIRRTNNVDGKNNPKLVKKYFNKLQDDLLEKYNALADRVNGLSK